MDRVRMDRQGLKDYIEQQQEKTSQPVAKVKKVPPTREEFIEAGFEPEAETVEIVAEKIEAEDLRESDEVYYADLLKDVPSLSDSKNVSLNITLDIRLNGKLKSHEILSTLQGG